MESLAKLRLLLAAVLAPLIVPLIVYLIFVFSFGSVVEKNQGIQTSISSATWLSYVTALVFGGAGYFWLRRKRWWTVWRYIFVGLVTGIASWIIFSIISQTLFFNRVFYAFIIAGMFMGATFWLVAYFQPDGKHLISGSSSGRRRRRR